jgi:hypothetical protein
MNGRLPLVPSGNAVAGPFIAGRFLYDRVARQRRRIARPNHIEGKEPGMNKAMLFGTGILAAAVLVGCGGGSDDAIMKEQIDLMNQTSDILEKITDAESMKKAEPELQKLKEKGEALKKKVEGWSEDRKKKAVEKHEKELKAAAQRVFKAGLTAATKAGGGGLKLPDLKTPEIKLPDVKLP